MIIITSYIESINNSHKKIKRTGDKGEGRPSRMEETAYLARLFMSLTHCSVKN